VVRSQRLFGTNMFQRRVKQCANEILLMRLLGIAYSPVALGVWWANLNAHSLASDFRNTHYSGDDCDRQCRMCIYDHRRTCRVSLWCLALHPHSTRLRHLKPRGRKLIAVPQRGAVLAVTASYFGSADRERVLKQAQVFLRLELANR
jgi:hypothetical protein